MGYKMGAMFLEQGKGLVNRTEYEARETLSMRLDSLFLFTTWSQSYRCGLLCKWSFPLFSYGI